MHTQRTEIVELNAELLAHIILKVTRSHFQPAASILHLLKVCLELIFASQTKLSFVSGLNVMLIKVLKRRYNEDRKICFYKRLIPRLLLIFPDQEMALF